MKPRQALHGPENRNASLQPRYRHTRACVGAGAKCKVPVGAARQIQLIRSMELIRIAICSPNAQC